MAPPSLREARQETTMLGDINPQSVRIAQQAVVYPGRNHVTTLTIKRYDGRRFTPVNLDDITRVVLAFPCTNPTIVFDSTVDAIFAWAGNTLTVDLSEYAMPASIQPSYLVVFDAEHPQGQVLVDDIDARLEFDFRLVPITGTTPPPTADFLTDAPQDGETYGRKDGAWVPLAALVSGVASVNGQSGVVVLSAADVGAATEAQGALAETAVQPGGLAAVATSGSYTDLVDTPTLGTAAAADTGDFDLAGTAAAAVAEHVADTTPHATILGLDRVGFSLTPSGPADVGEVVWNDEDKTLDIGLGDGITLQAGQELQVRGLNKSGVTMTNGQVVYISGAQGNRLVFSLAQANQTTADKTIAVLTQDIANNQQGQATVIGLVRGVDTSGFAEGSELWLSAATAGLMTNVKPAAPNHAVHLGYVVRSHTTIGSIFVRIYPSDALNGLQDVNIVAPNDGDTLEYDSATQTWVNIPNSGGSGEANTASNVGGGEGVFAQKVGVDLQFKTLIAGAGVTLTPSASTIEIVASGAGGAVDSVNGQTGVVVLDTDDIGEGATNLYFTNGRAAAAAPVQTVDGQTGNVNLSASYAPLSHVGDTGAAHGNASTSVAGFMSGADKTKLDGIAPGAQVNVPTNLTSTPGASTVVVASSTGDDATVLAATTSLAGVMSAADKTKLNGVAAGANNYVHPNHTGDVTSTGDGATVIAAGAVSNSKLANVNTSTIKGRSTVGTGSPEDLSAAQVRTLLNVADGANNYVHPNHTGDVTSTGDGATVIANDAVTNAKLANMATATLKGRTTAGTGDPQDLTAAQARSLLNVANGATALSAVQALTSTRNLALADINTFNVNSTANEYTVTIPLQSSVAWTADAEVHFLKANTGNVVIQAPAGVTLNGVDGGSVTISQTGGAASIKRRAADSWWVGGLLGDAEPGIGWGQTWQDMTASRAVDTTYTNTTGKPIMFAVRATNTSYSRVSIAVDGLVVASNDAAVSAGSALATSVAIVPAGATYSAVISVGTLSRWSELR